MKPHATLKVIHVASGDLWAGAEVQLFTLAQTLHNFEDISIRIILLNHGELEHRLKKEGIPVAVFPESQLNGLQILSHLIKQLKKQRPDIVHTHRIKENIIGGLAAKLAGNIPSMRTVHGSPEHKPGWHKPHKQILYFLDWFVGRYLQRKMIAVSKELAKQLQLTYSPEMIKVIENGVNVNTLLPYAKHMNVARNQNKPVKIGLVGRLVPVKRVDLYIRTAKHFWVHNPDITIHFHIYGDGPLRTDLEKLRMTLGLQDIVYFEGHCTEIYSEIASLDALLITSDHEGLPMTLLEAMILGTPIIAHAVGGIAQVLGNSEYGVTVNDHKPESYAQAILNCILQPESAISVSKKASAYIIENYSAKSNGEKYYSLYKEIYSQVAPIH